MSREFLERSIAACAVGVEGRVHARVTTLPLAEIRGTHERVTARSIACKIVVML